MKPSGGNRHAIWERATVFCDYSRLRERSWMGNCWITQPFSPNKP